MDSEKLDIGRSTSIKPIRAIILLAMLTLLLAGCSIASPSAEQTSSAATTQGSAAPESDSDARPSLITIGADATIASGGDYVFWSTQDKNSFYLYGYNVVTQKQFLVGGPADQLGSFASEGKTVAWMESVPLSDGSYNMAIRSYDLTTKAHSSIRVMDEYSQGSISVDQGILYYSDETSGHTGTYAFNLSTRKEKMINANYHDNIVEADGVMVWSEAPQVFGPGPHPSSLHMAKVDGSVKDAVIANNDGSLLNGYSVSGRKVVYTYHGGADEQLYQYNVDSGTTTVLSGLPTKHPQIRGNTVVWLSQSNTQTTTSIQSYNSTLSSSIVTNLIAAQLGIYDAILVGEKDIAFTVAGGTNPGYSIYLMSRNISNIKFK